MNAIEINENDMAYRIAGQTLARAWRDSVSGRWTVEETAKPRMVSLDRDQAITALTIIECLASGMVEDHPLIQSLLQELPA